MHVDAAGAAEVLEERPVVVLDVRTPAEYAGGHLAGATLVDFRAPDFEARAAALDRDREYLVYCRSGGRSAGAVDVLRKLGFRKLVNLDGGYRAWVAGGHPVER
jgi:rhodanese-related sulfurtransferase